MHQEIIIQCRRMQKQQILGQINGGQNFLESTKVKGQPLKKV